jgi:hypothetical protein
MNTNDLIASLSAEVKPQQRLEKPAYWCARLLAVCALYAIATQLCLGLRSDFSMQLSRPFFVAEIALLFVLLLTSVLAAVLSMYPDGYQKPKFLKLPYLAFAAVFGLVAFQLLMPHDTRMAGPEAGTHGIECALCISAVALIPSALIFAILRKGASVRPFQAGAFAVLAASAIGGFTIRLAEANDSIEHLVQWHYIPTFLFATLGALIGKWLLKW